ncbi:MAG: GNAT family N-acetyltransferase [Oscillospiraceae bacterium]|jgi:GNAT superfamily N-acetyltransferase|nr:GNAT family N-acetyltransferase [Oscillospiraceae bacterium]
MNLHQIETTEIPQLAELFTAFDNNVLILGRRKMIESGEGDIFTFEDNGRMIAEISVNYYYAGGDADFAVSGKRACLSALRVLPEYQGRGLAQSLITSILDVLREKGYTEATIGVEDDNTVARHIYSKLGFTTFIKRCSETFQVDSFDFNLYLKTIEKQEEKHAGQCA